MGLYYTILRKERERDGKRNREIHKALRVLTERESDKLLWVMGLYYKILTKDWSINYTEWGITLYYRRGVTRGRDEQLCLCLIVVTILILALKDLPSKFWIVHIKLPQVAKKCTNYCKSTYFTKELNGQSKSCFLQNILKLFVFYDIYKSNNYRMWKERFKIQNSTISPIRFFRSFTCENLEFRWKC